MENKPKLSTKKIKLAAEEELVIPIIEETVTVRKDVEEKGKILISKEVQEEELALKVALKEQKITITRVEKNELIEEAPSVRHEGNRTIIPVVKEVAVIVKKLLLVEEIHLLDLTTTENETLHTTIRRES